VHAIIFEFRADVVPVLLHVRVIGSQRPANWHHSVISWPMQSSSYCTVLKHKDSIVHMSLFSGEEWERHQADGKQVILGPEQCSLAWICKYL
jgi:hypothetical protein